MQDENKLKFNSPNEKRIEQKAEAFLNLAQDPYGFEGTQPEAPTPKEKVQSNLNIGPKYMSALEEVSKFANIRSFRTELPLLKTGVTISPLTGKEEQTLKTASTAMTQFLVQLNKILFSHAQFDDTQFPSFEEFLEELFPPDKSMMIWALLVSSYVSLPSMEKTCSKCGEKFIVEPTPQELIHTDSLPMVWDKTISPKDYTEVVSIMDGFITFELGMPSEKVRILITSIVNPEKIKSNVAKSDSLFSFKEAIMYFTRSITVGTGDNRTVLVDPQQDIYPFLLNLPPKISDEVRSKVKTDLFDIYMPNFYLETTCNSCGNKEQVNLDPETAFFRKTILI